MGDSSSAAAATPSAPAPAVGSQSATNPFNQAPASVGASAAIKAAADAAAAAATSPAAAAAASSGKKKAVRRLCRFPGCTKVIKSQGHCQRHGAKAKRCRVEGCEKQAQGTHDGMCKKHYRAVHVDDTSKDSATKGAGVKTPPSEPPPPEGNSVYDSILPQSIAYRPTSHPAGGGTTTAAAAKSKKDDVVVDAASHVDAAAAAAAADHDEDEDKPAPEGTTLMPLVAFLKHGRTRPVGWHRNAERRARGMFPVSNLQTQLEPWERQLALVEILLLSGGTPYVNFRDLAHAWGRDKGFHHVLANSVCERRGEVERKRRSDSRRAGDLSTSGKGDLTPEEREAYRKRQRRTPATPRNLAVASPAAATTPVAASASITTDAAAAPAAMAPAVATTPTTKNTTTTAAAASSGTSADDDQKQPAVTKEAAHGDTEKSTQI